MIGRKKAECANVNKLLIKIMSLHMIKICISSVIKKLIRPELIITVGIPGSGKSTWIRSQSGFEVVSPDEIRRSLGDISDQSKNTVVYGTANEKVKNLLSQGKNVIYDATNLESKHRLELLGILPKNVKLKAKVFHTDPAEAKRRIKNDLEKGVNRSKVPDDIIDNMYKNYLKTINENELKSEGFEVL